MSHLSVLTLGPNVVGLAVLHLKHNILVAPSHCIVENYPEVGLQMVSIV